MSRYLPEYRVWAGFTIWIGMTLIDFITLSAKPARWDGALSLLGFLIALGWSQS